MLVAGSALFCLVSPLAAQEADGLSLQISPGLDAVIGPAPRFQDDGGADLQGGGDAVARGRGKTALRRDGPFRPSEFSLRLARVLEAEGLSLQLSPDLGPVLAAAPRFREENGPGIRLAFSSAVAVSPAAGKAFPLPTAPAPRPNEYPLRLAQAMAPQLGGGRQPRWSNRWDPGLDLQPARRLGMPGAADFGRPVPPVGMDSDQEPVGGMGGDPRAPQGWPSARQAGPAPVAPEGEASAGGRFFSWGIPPIRSAGAISYSLRQQSNSDGLRTLDQILNSNIRGASYIYAPWMATVTGGIGFITGVNKSGAGDGGSFQSSNSSLVGDGSLNLFPSSRFPFSASFSRSDSRSSSAATSVDYTNTRFGLRQDYSSEDYKQRLSAGFDHSTISARGAQDRVSALFGSYSAPIGSVSNSFAARLSVSERDGTGERVSLFSANSSHSYSPEENFSLQGYTNFTDNQLRYDAGNGIAQSRGQFLQMGTSASWRPEFEDEEDYPLNLNAGVMYSGARMDSAFGVTQSQRIAGNTSAHYRYSPNLSMNGSGTVNYVMSDNGEAQLFYGLGSGLSYAGDPLRFGKFSYNWGLGSGGSWTGGGSVPTNLSANAQANHSLGRSFLTSAGDSVSLSLSQSLGTYLSQSAGNSSFLSSNAMASYSLRLGDQFSGSINGGFSDNISNGANAQHYQSLNLGFNGQGQLSSLSSANVNLMFIWSNQTMTTSFDGMSQQNNSQRMSTAGSASYMHSRFAGMPGLRYSLLFSADTLLRDNRLYGDANSVALRPNFTVENRWEYRIGRLDLRLSATQTDTGGKKNALLFFQVTRQIGSY